MKWITRERPKIDRIACPWLIKRFIDPNGEIMFVPSSDVLSKAKELDAIPYDVANVEYSHYEDECTFDYFLKKHNISDPALHKIALIVRGADTDNINLTPQSAGILAIFAGLSINFRDDFEMLDVGMKIYDALYSWANIK